MSLFNQNRDNPRLPGPKGQREETFMEMLGKIAKNLGKLLFPVAIIFLILAFGIIWYIDSAITETATAITERLNFLPNNVWPIKLLLFSFTAFVTGLTLYYPFSKESRKKWVKVVYPFVGLSLLFFAFIGYFEQYDKDNLLGSCVYKPRSDNSKPYVRKKDDGDCILVTKTNFRAMQAYAQGIKPQYWDLKAIRDLDQIQWFDGPNAMFFYNQKALERGELRVFKGAGYDRLDGSTLEPITFEIIDKHIKPRVRSAIELEERRLSEQKAAEAKRNEDEAKRLEAQTAKQRAADAKALADARKVEAADTAKVKALEAKAKAEEAKAEVERLRIIAGQRALELRTQKEAEEREAQRNREVELEKVRIEANREAERKAEESKREAERITREDYERRTREAREKAARELQTDTQKVREETTRRIQASLQSMVIQNTPTNNQGIRIDAGKEVLSWEGAVEFRVNNQLVSYSRKLFRDYQGQVAIYAARGNFNPVQVRIALQPETVIAEVKSVLNLPNVNLAVKLE